MITVEETVGLIDQLPDHDRKALLQRMAERDADEWDKQIEADALAGRLDDLAEEALADFKAGRTRKLLRIRPRRRFGRRTRDYPNPYSVTPTSVMKCSKPIPDIRPCV